MKDESKRLNTCWFTRARFGMFIHWGLYSLGARHEWLKNFELLSDEEYQRYFEAFEPDLYDPEKWAKQAKAAGMKYVVITTKHHEGFCLWDSKYTDYKATNTPAGRGLLKEFVEAFRNEGIRIGFYYSLIDWHHEDFLIDIRHPEFLRRLDKYSALRSNRSGVNSANMAAIGADHPFHDEIAAVNSSRDMGKYAKYMRDQVSELLTDFGKIDIIWFDFSYPQERYGKSRKDWESGKLVKLIRSLQPDIIINNRLDLENSADFVTPEQIQLNECPQDSEGNTLVWEGCQTFSGAWGYSRDESSWKKPGMLIEMLVNHVSRGGNLLMNVGPNARGEFDPRAVEALNVYAQWMRLHERSIYNCENPPDGLQVPGDCRYTYNPRSERLYLHLFNWPFKSICLPGLIDKVEYAQLLNDGSEIKFSSAKPVAFNGGYSSPPESAIVLSLPVIKPDVEVPVVELFLK